MVWLLTGAVVAVEIPYPLVHGHARNVLTIVTVLLFAVATVYHAATSRGPTYAATLALVAGAGGFGAEVLGVHTGVPFGSYRYTGGLGAQIYGVPIVVAFAWLMMTHPALSVAARVTSSAVLQWLCAAIALASWDLFLDPQMVAAHHWRWLHVSPSLPGIGDVPLTNFGGWLLVSLLVMAVLVPLSRTEQSRDDRPALTLWVWTWLSSGLANLAFFDRPAVAVWGLLAMGTVGIPLVHRLRVRPT